MCEIATGFRNGGAEFIGIGDRWDLVCAVFWDGDGEERSAYLHLGTPFHTKLFPHLQSIQSPISSDTNLGTRAVVSLACAANDDRCTQ
jgi:hypothetical protein